MFSSFLLISFWEQQESYMHCYLLYTCLPELSFTSRSSLYVKNGNLHQATWSVPVWFPCRRRSAVTGRDGGGLWKEVRVGKVEQSFPEVAPLLMLRLGPGWALGLFGGGYKFRASAFRGCKYKVGHWEPAALRIQPERKLGVKRDAACGAVGLDVKLERGRKAQGCAAAHMLESQLCFVFASNPPTSSREENG